VYATTCILYTTLKGYSVSLKLLYKETFVFFCFGH